MDYVYLKNGKGEVCYAHPQVGYVEITKEEYDIAIHELNNPPITEEQILVQQIDEAKQYLASTDHKFYNGYKPKEGEDLVEIERLRDEAREFIRANEGDK